MGPENERLGLGRIDIFQPRLESDNFSKVEPRKESIFGSKYEEGCKVGGCELHRKFGGVTGLFSALPSTTP